MHRYKCRGPGINKSFTIKLGQGNFAIRDVVIDPFAGEQIILAGSIRFDTIDNSILRQLGDDIVAFGICIPQKSASAAAIS